MSVSDQGSHRPHDGKGGLRSTLAMFASFGFANTQLGVLAAPPVARQNNFTLLFIDVSDDIRHEGSEELLTATHIDVRRAPPGRWQCQQNRELG